MGRQLLTGHPALNEVHYHPVWKNFGWKNFLKAPLKFLQDGWNHFKSEVSFLAKIRSQRFDLVVDVICTPRTAIVCRWSGAPVRQGLKTRWNRDWAYTWLSDGPGWTGKYAAQARLNLLQPQLGEQLINHPPAQWLNSWIPNNDQCKERINLFLEDSNLRGKKFALLSPTHRRPLRRWPHQSYVSLALRMAKQFQWHMVWLWGPGEFEYVSTAHEELKVLLREEGLDETFSVLTPLLTLPEVAELAHRAEQWIGNTNGLSHVAVAGGAKTVQIHGPTSPKPWTHPDASKHIPVQREQGCLRCDKNTCHMPKRECLDLLEVDQVFAAVVQLKTASQPSG